MRRGRRFGDWANALLTHRNFWYPVFGPSFKASDKEKKTAEYSLAQCNLFRQADALEMTAPMWNFGVPAILTAWLAQVLMSNITFSIGPAGFNPMHRIRKTVVLSSFGGVYEAGDLRDGVRNGIKAAVGFVGITDVDVVWDEGQNSFFFKDHAERKAKAMAEAAALGLKVAKG